MSGKVDIRPEGPKVFVNLNDRTFCEFEPEIAERIGRALIEAAKVAAETRDAERIALDSALLMRTGAPFSLSNNRRILDVARNEAAFNREYRRAIPSIKSRTVLGTPSIIMEAPPCKISRS